MTEAAIPFSEGQPPSPPGWFERVVLERSDPRGATRYAKSILAKQGPSPETGAQIAEAFVAYGIRNPDAQRSLSAQLLSEVIVAFLGRDHTLTPSALATCTAMAETLHVSTFDLHRIRIAAAEDVYRTAVRHAFLEYRLTNESQQALRSLSDQLGLDDKRRCNIIREEAARMLNALTERLIVDRRFSAADERRIRTFASGLGGTLPATVSDDVPLQHLCRLWALENAPLAALDVPIWLERGERCYYAGECSWREPRTHTPRADRGSLRTGGHVIRGVVPTFGAFTTDYIAERALTEVTSGTLYVTTKRLVMNGLGGLSSISWRAMFGVELYTDAIRVEKNTGADPYLFLPPAEIAPAAIVIARCMNGD